MKKVSSTDMKNVQKWALPVGVVAVGLISAVAWQASSNDSKAAMTEKASSDPQAQTTESPAPTTEPKIMVNGTQIPVDKEGSTEVAIPGGKARVDVSDGKTRVTTSDEARQGDTSNVQSGNVSVKIDSQSNGGASWGTTRVYGSSSSSHGSGTSFNSTSIISTESGNVSITEE